MIDISYILKRKKLQIVFLFYVLLILPLLTPLAQNIPIQKAGLAICINIFFFLAIYIFSFFLSPRTEKIVYTFLLIITMIPSSMFLAYLIFARVLLEQDSITSLFETNPEESKEFVMYYLNIWVVLGVLTYIIIPAFMIWKMKSYRPLKIKKYKYIFIFSLTAILSVIFISRLSQTVYFINFYNTYASYKIRLYNENKEFEYRQLIPYEVKNENKDSIPQTIVVVIGESLTRNHMQLYGYGRKTNPLLSEKSKNLCVFTDVISPQVHTIPVMRSVFTFTENSYPEYFVKKPSLFELFNRAGYETYLISNQSFGGKFGTSYDVVLNLAKNKYDLSPFKQHDEVVISKLNEILQSDTVNNKFIVIHLIGNHMAYKFRYPSRFKLFDNNSDKFIKDVPYIDNEARKTIDEYDNSVAYNDYIINSVIEKLLQYENCGKSAMVYFSDHGEELYDFRNFAGHAYEKVSRYMCEVPFILWMSDNFRKERNDLFIDTVRPYSTGDFIFSVSHLANLGYQDYDTTRSIFSKDFVTTERYVGNISYKKISKFN